MSLAPGVTAGTRLDRAGANAPAPLPEKASESPEFQNALAAAEAKTARDKFLAVPHSPARWSPHVDRSKVDPQIVKAAEEWESVFLDQMMQVMRGTIEAGDMDLENNATHIYRGMLDSEYAQKAAHSGGIGLADMMIDYLARQSYTLPKGQTPARTAEAAPDARSKDPGGTHAGQSNR